MHCAMLALICLSLLPHSCCCGTRFAVIVQVITVDADAQLTAVGAVEHSPGVNVIPTHTAGSHVQNRVKH